VPAKWSKPRTEKAEKRTRIEKGYSTQPLNKNGVIN